MVSGYVISISPEITEDEKMVKMAKEHIEGILRREDITSEEKAGYIWNLKQFSEDFFDALAEEMGAN